MKEPGTTDVQSYTLAQLRQMLGLSRHAITRLIEVGYVSPSRGPGKALRFSFRDLVLLRSAHELRKAGIATRQILRSLRELTDALPADLPLGDLRVTATGDRITVRRAGEAAPPWEIGTGQMVMDFNVAAASGAVSVIGSAAAPSMRTLPRAAASAESMFQAAEALEETDAAAAETTYRRLLAEAPDHTRAYVNLGFLLCEAGRFGEAVTLYDKAVRACPDDPLVHYNRGVALEALQRAPEALGSYERALALQPDLADAHRNAALLYSHAGQDQMAIRHFSAYRRLQRSG